MPNKNLPPILFWPKQIIDWKQFLSKKMFDQKNFDQNILIKKFAKKISNQSCFPTKKFLTKILVQPKFFPD